MGHSTIAVVPGVFAGTSSFFSGRLSALLCIASLLTTALVHCSVGDTSIQGYLERIGYPRARIDPVGYGSDIRAGSICIEHRLLAHAARLLDDQGIRSCQDGNNKS